MISVNTHLNPQIRMQKYNSHCISRRNWFDLARAHCSFSEPQPLNPFESIKRCLTGEVDDLPLPAYCWEQSVIPSPWKIRWTEAAAYGGGLKLDDPVFRSKWTKYCRAHAWINCHPEVACECEGHNYLGTHSTEGHAPAAAATAKPALIPLIVIETPNLTSTEVDASN